MNIKDFFAGKKIINIADKLTSEQLEKIGHESKDGYIRDKSSRSHRDDKTKKAIDCAMQVTKEKKFPWAKASNIKYPLITMASIEFGAKIYPAIINNGEVVKGKVYGKDKIEVIGQPDEQGRPTTEMKPLGKFDRAERVSTLLNYQFMEVIPNWERDTDRLSNMLPTIGCMFKKIYWDPIMNIPRSDLVLPQDIYIRYDARSVKEATRVTHKYELTSNDLKTNVLSDIFLEVDEETLGDGDSSNNETESERTDNTGYHTILEQHTWIDLDEDGYKEPYIITMLESNGQVLSIVPRYTAEKVQYKDNKVVNIDPINHFVEYGFIPSQDGSVYSVGFGELLLPINESVNSVVNQLIDAGTLANTKGGIIGAGLRLKGGSSLKLLPGEWKMIPGLGDNIRNSIVPLTSGEPSPTLFQLLGMLISAGKEIASIKDLTEAGLAANMPATTTVALINESMTNFKAIWQRVHRSMKEEIKTVLELNKIFLSEEDYKKITDDQKAVKTDFELKEYEADVVPVSSAYQVSDMQKMGNIQGLMQFINDPYVNQVKLREIILKSFKFEDLDDLVQEPPAPQADPAAEIQMKNLMAQNKLLEAQLLDITQRNEVYKFKTLAEIQQGEVKTNSDAAKSASQSVKNMADAEAVETGTQNQIYINQAEQATERLTKDEDRENTRNPEQGSVPQVEEAPRDGIIPQSPGAIVPEN